MTNGTRAAAAVAVAVVGFGCGCGAKVAGPSRATRPSRSARMGAGAPENGARLPAGPRARTRSSPGAARRSPQRRRHLPRAVPPRRLDYWFPSPPHPYGGHYKPERVTAAGAIEGVVTWRHPPAVFAGGRGAGCGGVADDALAVDARGRVAGAVVYLRDIRAGRPLFGDDEGTRGLQIGGVIERGRCRFSPHIQLVAPIGALLTVASVGGSRGGEITAKVWNSGRERLLFRLALDGAGAEQRRRIDRSGFVEIRADGDPIANAWLVVAAHPYYAVTGAGGRFRLDRVPPGRYTLAVWHEPVLVGLVASGKRRLAGPFRAERPVVVRAGRTARRSLRLGR